MSDPTGMANDVRCSDAAEGAALGLLGLMTGISEEYWCAGLMSGMQYDLWHVEAGWRYGRGVISERQASLLRLLHEECDGWWVWSGSYGPKFLRTTAWLDHLRARGGASLRSGTR